jgi:hypothetical protein
MPGMGNPHADRFFQFSQDENRDTPAEDVAPELPQSGFDPQVFAIRPTGRRVMNRVAPHSHHRGAHAGIPQRLLTSKAASHDPDPRAPQSRTRTNGLSQEACHKSGIHRNDLKMRKLIPQSTQLIDLPANSRAST